MPPEAEAVEHQPERGKRRNISDALHHSSNPRSRFIGYLEDKPDAQAPVRNISGALVLPTLLEESQFELQHAELQGGLSRL